MTNLAEDTIDRSDIAALIKWLSNDPLPRLTKGSLTVEFEKEWSNTIGVKHSVFVNSGSSAILLMLYALKNAKKLKNAKIIVPTLSWVTDVSSCMQLGLRPILCDCNLGDLSLDLYGLEQLFIKESPAAVILVSVLGLVPKMNEVIKLCKKYDVILLEDVCESLGSKFEGQSLGTFGECSVFSLYFGHHLSTIEGGMVCTNNDELYDILLMLRSHGWDRDLSKEKQLVLRTKYQLDDFDALYSFYYPGFNLRSTDLQAFIGLQQLKKLEQFIWQRQTNFQNYDLLTEKVNMLKLDYWFFDTISSMAFPVVNINRQKIVEKLKENEIEVRPLIAGSMALKPFWEKQYSKQHFENADLVNNYGFYLPNHHKITLDDIQKISTIVNEFGA